MNLQPGTILHNRYKITRILGQGGMGAVYQAHDISLIVDVAIKVNFSRSEGSTSQFMREAQMLAKLRHPNLPRVIEYFTDQGNEFLVMDYIPGDDLKKLVKNQGTQPLPKVLDWAEQLGDALTYLHNQTPPIFHRDIKPDNVKITPQGQAVLVDFGIAKAAYSNQQTQLGARGYTPGYAPPEQYGGGRTGSYTDQYGLAATIYFLLTGKKPLDSVSRVVDKKAMPTVITYNQTIPLHVSKSIDQALKLDPNERYPSVAVFINTLTGKNAGSFAATARAPLNQENATMTAINSQPLPPASFQQQQSTAQAFPSTQPSYPDAQSLPSEPRTRKKKTPIAAILGIGFGLLVVLVIGVLGVLYLTGNLFQPSPTPDIALAMAQTMTASAPLAKETEDNLTSTEIPTNTPEPTITLTETQIPTPTLTNTPAPTSTPTPIAVGQLVFISDRGGDGNQIWMMDVGMDVMGNLVSSVQQLTFDSGDKSYPAWSQDGRYLVYSAPGASATDGLDLYRLDMSQENPSPFQLTARRGDDIEASFSADGITIAFDNNGRDDGGRQLRFINVDGTNDVRVSLDFFEYAAVWDSSAASKYYFVLLGTGHKTLYWRNVGDDQADVNPFDRSSFFGRLGEVNEPALSPDGNYFAYTQENGSRTNIYLVDAHTGGADVFQLTSSNSDGMASFSADSSWIAFTSERDGNSEIYIMDLTGQQLTNLSNNSGVDKHPAWLPVQ